VSTAHQGNISVPAAFKAPRSFDDVERSVLKRVADALIPATDGAVSAGDEPGFWDALDTALDARSDAFDAIADALGRLRSTDPDDLWNQLQAMDEHKPGTFQALSTVIAGAWLLTPGTRERIGYQGQLSDKAALDEAADELSSGVLNPVLDRAPEEGPRWIR
jgi:hypothetical protein